jgi:hypothetical protein
LLLVAVAAAPGEVRGTLTVNGKAVPLVHGYAGLEPNPFDDTKNDIVIVFTDRAIPADVLAAHDIGGLPGAAEAASVRNYLRIKLRRESGGWEIGHRTITHDVLGGRSLQVSPDPVAKFDARTVSDARVAGVVTTKGPQTFPHDDTHEFEVSFDLTVMPLKSAPAPSAPSAPVTRPSVPGKGTPLPAGGGAPGRALLAYVEAMQKGDLDALLKTDATLADATASQLDDIRTLLPLLTAAAPKNVNVLRGWVDGDEARLEVEGLVMGQKKKGGAVMTRVRGAWKVVEIDWD